jgi:hypothetical protein
MKIAHTFWSAFRVIHRVGCLVRGHELVLDFDPQLLALRCLACGYRTKGWALNGPRSPRSGIVMQLPTARRIRNPRAA